VQFLLGQAKAPLISGAFAFSAKRKTAKACPAGIFGIDFAIVFV
jgi:hypothetical protein